MMDIEKQMLEVLEAEPTPDSLGLASLAPGNDRQTREAGHPCFDWQGQRGRRRAAHTRPGQTPVR